MKPLVFMLVLSLIQMVPCVRDAEAAPITYQFSTGPAVWTYPLCPPDLGDYCVDPSDPVFSVFGTFTMDGDVLVAFDGLTPGEWEAWGYSIDGGPGGLDVYYSDISGPYFNYSLPGGFVSYRHPQPHWGYFSYVEIEVVPEPVPDPGSSLLLLGIGISGLRAFQRA